MPSHPPTTWHFKGGNRDNLAVRVSAKLEEGDFKGAVRLASSDDTVADSNSHTSSLTSKHPPLHPNSIIPPPSDLSEFNATSVSEELIARAILSFPNGSLGGPDGLRPQHLKDLIGFPAGEVGPALLRALTTLVNISLRVKHSHQSALSFLVQH